MKVCEKNIPPFTVHQLTTTPGTSPKIRVNELEAHCDLTIQFLERSSSTYTVVTYRKYSNEFLMFC